MKDFAGYKDFEIDSQIIYSHLSHTQDVKEVWKDADGALALSWYDKQRKQLNLIRNIQRPLFFCYSKDNKQVFWASESWMLAVGMSRNGINRHDIMECKPDQLYTFQLNDAKEVFHTETPVPPFVEKWKASYNYGQSRGGNYYDGWEGWTPPSQNNQQQPQTKKPVQKTASQLIITEFHNIPNRPTAFGTTMDGSSVRIVIPQSKYLEAKDKLVTPKGNGFYVAPKLFKNVLQQKEDYWCNWSDLKFVTLLPDVRIQLKKEGGFSIIKGAESQSAPWFDPKIRLNVEAFKEHTQKGCDCCGISVEWGEREDLLWADKTTFYCGACRLLPYVETYTKKQGN